MEQESLRLREELAYAQDLGFQAEYIDADPVTHQPGICFANQLELHPVLYVEALVKAAELCGAKIFAHTAITGFPKKGYAQAGDKTIRYDRALIATHVPLKGGASSLGAALFQTNLMPYTTYALKVEMQGYSLPEMIWSDSGDPFLYLRIQQTSQGPFCILGGEDHKTGQEKSAVRHHESLQHHLHRLFPKARITHRWSGQVIETADGLPFIGPTSSNQFVATGFSGNGMTFGTLSALMFRDWLRGHTSPWAALLNPSRRTIAALGECVRENIDYPLHLVTCRLGAEGASLDAIHLGEAKVTVHKGKWVAAYRSEDGRLSVRSAVCPHMGCIVSWNDAERTWDCPCHGSRFKATGEVLLALLRRRLRRIIAPDQIRHVGRPR